MQPALVTQTVEALHQTFVGEEGACGRVLISWALAGGVATGGLVVGALTVTGRVSPGLQLLMAPVLFLVGVVLGYTHGAFLAIVGRPASVSLPASAQRSLVAALCSLPGLGVAWVVTAGISVTAAVVVDQRGAVVAVALSAWVIGIALCVWAAFEGLAALRHVIERFPRFRSALHVAAVTLPVTMLALLRFRPLVPGTDTPLNWIGASILALASTLWVVLPLAFMVLRLVSRDGGAAGRGSEICL